MGKEKTTNEEVHVIDNATAMKRSRCVHVMCKRRQ